MCSVYTAALTPRVCTLVLFIVLSNRVVLHNVVRDLGAGGAMHDNGGHGIDLYMYILHLSCASSPKFLYITQYGSTVYIGIAMVFVFPPYIR